MTGPEFRNDSPRWTDWGWPDRPATVRHGWSGGMVSTCCHRTAGELPSSDRMVADLAVVNCPGRSS